MAEKLTIRELRGDDLFPMLEIIGKLDIAEKLAAEVADLMEDEDNRSRGVRIAGVLGKAVLSNIGRVRGDLNALLADLTGTDVPTITGLGLGAYIGLVKALVTRPEFAEVFTSAVSPGTADGDES